MCQAGIHAESRERGMNRTLAGRTAPAEEAADRTGCSWDEVRTEPDLDEDSIARHRAQFEAGVRAYKLAEVRRRQRVTQQDLAHTLGISQSRVSQIERQNIDDTVLSTLAAYLEALGGSVRVVADFGDEQVVLSRVVARDLAGQSAEAAK